MLIAYFFNSYPRSNNIAAIAPKLCATTNIGTLDGATPANVSLIDRAMLMAGFANEVDEVNQ